MLFLTMLRLPQLWQQKLLNAHFCMFVTGPHWFFNSFLSCRHHKTPQTHLAAFLPLSWRKLPKEPWFF